MTNEEMSNMSWMDASKLGVLRKDWCSAISVKRNKKKYAPPKAVASSEKKFRAIPLEIYSCSLRGDVVAMTTCRSCAGGNKPLEIFECSVHGECTVDKMPDPGRHVKGLCKTCPDRQGKPII